MSWRFRCLLSRARFDRGLVCATTRKCRSIGPVPPRGRCRYATAAPSSRRFTTPDGLLSHDDRGRPPLAVLVIHRRRWSSAGRRTTRSAHGGHPGDWRRAAARSNRGGFPDVHSGTNRPERLDTVKGAGAGSGRPEARVHRPPGVRKQPFFPTLRTVRSGLFFDLDS